MTFQQQEQPTFILKWPQISCAGVTQKVCLMRKSVKLLLHFVVTYFLHLFVKPFSPQTMNMVSVGI